MTEDDDKAKTDHPTLLKTTTVLGFVLLVAISYQIGLARGRGEKECGEYTALKTQYDRAEAEYSASRTQYEQVMTEYSAFKAQCSGAVTQYTALKAQYDRIEAQRAKGVIEEPQKRP